MKHAQTSPSKHPAQTDPHLALLGQLLSGAPEVEFAVLVGSRAGGTARTKSDWDIALQWHPQANWLALLGTQETLRRSIADILGASPEDIDLIDLPRANLAMRANAAEDGVVLKGEDTLAWARFLTRIWRELEDFYWERAHGLDLYHAETARIATEQSALLDVAKQRLTEGLLLRPLEPNGVLHALQVLIENAIGKAKQLLKARGETVPISAYDAFSALVRHGEIEQAQLTA